LQYKKRKGEKEGNVLPDFFIGAHAAVSGYSLISRDKGRFSTKVDPIVQTINGLI
jgi:predicted nucleic acid-binding protein